MKHKIFSIFDSKAAAYLPPFFMPEEGMAIRLFKQCVNDSQHQFSKDPGDYTLFNLGAWDDNTSKIMTHPGISLHNGLELLQNDTPESQLSLIEEQA
nr:MAG: nonstructural protein [Microvirus sp.]